MTKFSLSRRKFIATSMGTALSAAALSAVPLLTTNAQGDAPPSNPEQVLSSLTQIAPNGIVQDRLDGSAADLLTALPLGVAHARSSALAGVSASLSSQTILAGSGLQVLQQKVSDIQASMALDGLRFTNYTLETQVEGAWAERDTATVIWTEKIVYNLAGDPDPQAPQTSFETLTHLTSLRRDGSAWVIESDDNQFGIQSNPIEGQAKPVDMQPSGTDRLASSNGYRVFIPLIVQGSSQVATTQEVANLDTTNATLAATYSREAASGYALARGGQSNENGYHDFGNNCTNFISQCLKAGGWPEKTGYYKSTDGWWYHGLWPTYAAYPWHNAHYWWWFTQNTGRGTILSSIWDLWFGDILQYDWQKDGTVDHSAIVSSRSYNGTIYMAQHTSNYASKPLSQIYGEYKDTCYYYAWRMKTSF